jgi:hypothetical protein
VHGKVRQRTVDRDVAGAPGTTMAVTFTDLEAVSFGLDLTRCRAQFQRAPIGPQTGPVEEESPSGSRDGMEDGPGLGAGAGGPAAGSDSAGVGIGAA